MVEPLRRRSTLASFDLAARTAPSGDSAMVTLAQRSFIGKVSLRGNPDEAAFGAAVRKVTGLELSGVAGRVSSDEAITLLSVGPDEWLLICAGLDEAQELTRQLSAGFDGLHALAMDFSSGLTTIRLGGAAARAVLQKGCSLDLDSPHFVPGRCERVRLGNADVVLHQLEEDPAGAGSLYDIHVGRSYAVSLWHWLHESSLEYGIAVAIA